MSLYVIASLYVFMFEYIFQGMGPNGGPMGPNGAPMGLDGIVMGPNGPMGQKIPMRPQLSYPSMMSRTPWNRAPNMNYSMMAGSPSIMPSLAPKPTAPTVPGPPSMMPSWAPRPTAPAVPVNSSLPNSVAQNQFNQMAPRFPASPLPFMMSECTPRSTAPAVSINSIQSIHSNSIENETTITKRLGLVTGCS